MIDNKSFETARLNKDKSFDGSFYFGVKTTGIFCRPSCPAPIAKEKNVVYFNNIYEALDHGFRPCLRCRPDVFTERRGYKVDASDTIKRSLALISKGYLNNNSVEDLAGEVNITSRHLRKIYENELGIPPIKLGVYHRALFAKTLLLSSNLRITDIVFASGFGSIRQFNKVFKDMFKKSPSQFRRDNDMESICGNKIKIPYDDDFNYGEIIDFMRPRLINGIEHVDGDKYYRTFNINGCIGHFSIEDNPGDKNLLIEIFCDDLNVYMDIYYRVKQMFDLDVDLGAVKRTLYEDKLFQGKRVYRLPVAFDPFEFLIRAILGQQITIKAATTLAARVAERADNRYSCDIEELTHVFPDQMQLLGLDIQGLGITNRRVETIKRVVESLVEGKFSLSMNQSYDEFYKDFIDIKGIGDWTVNYVAMRGLGMPDAFPAMDLGIIKALQIVDRKPKAKEIIERAEGWRPYRAYGALCLWLNS